MKERTPWYPHSINPVRRGVYERFITTIGIRWSYWNGKFWGGFATLYTHAVNNKRSPTAHPNERWRGLARKP